MDMDVISLILIFYIGGLWQTEALSVTGELGKDVLIQCSHTDAFSNIKYFCKAACNYEDVLISSRVGGEDAWGKYSISDKGNTFHVAIAHLTEEDSGTYWCGIERFGLDTYTEVILTVIKEDTDSDETIISSGTRLMLVYIGAGLVLLVLVLAVALLIFFKHRNRSVSISSGKNDNTVYATPSSLKEDTPHPIATSFSSSANKEVDADGGVRHEDDCYSNTGMSSQPQSQPDGLLYATVSFNKHTDCCDVAPLSADVTYSSVKAADGTNSL